MSEDEGDKRVRIVHDLVPDDWDKGPLSLAHELRQMLKSVVDAGTNIDSGGGDGVADLWPVVGGVEYHVQINIKRDPVWTGKCQYCPARFLTAAELQEHEKECPSRAGSNFT